MRTGGIAVSRIAEYVGRAVDYLLSDDRKRSYEWFLSTRVSAKATRRHKPDGRSITEEIVITVGRPCSKSRLRLASHHALYGRGYPVGIGRFWPSK